MPVEAVAFSALPVLSFTMNFNQIFLSFLAKQNTARNIFIQNSVQHIARSCLLKGYRQNYFFFFFSWVEKGVQPGFLSDWMSALPTRLMCNWVLGGNGLWKASTNPQPLSLGEKKCGSENVRLQQYLCVCSEREFSRQIHNIRFKRNMHIYLSIIYMQKYCIIINPCC